MRQPFGSRKIGVAIALIAALVLGAATYRSFTRTRWRSVAEDDQVAAAITQLRSGDPMARESAKQALLNQGSEAARALIAALEELFLDPKPHFELGNEAKGAEALRHHDNLPVEDWNPSERLSIDITWRLKQDMIELLGRLRDQAAVPLLIELTRREMHTSQNEYLHPPMKALVEIGEPAVPNIIEALESVRRTEAASLSTCCPNLTDAERRGILESREEIMIARLAIVLGDIGDKRALPHLKDLIAPPKSRHQYASRYIRPAIEKIQAKLPSDKNL